MTISLKSDLRWAILLFGLNAIIQSAYAIEVCPYIESLGNVEIITVNLIIAVFLIIARHLFFKSFYSNSTIRYSSRKRVITDGLFLFAGGIIWGTYNGFIHGFPMGSAMKILTGFLSVGILTGISLFIIRKVNLLKMNSMETEEFEASQQKYSPLSKDLLYLAISIIILVSINGIFIIIKDLQWMTTLEMQHYKFAIRSITIEVLFIAAVYSFYIILISLFYSSYLKLQLNNQKVILNAVSNGIFTSSANTFGNDEFGVLGHYTNKMIDQLKEQTEITKSIEYAKNLQEAILPSSGLLIQNLPDHFILYKPKDIVSGDFYWIKRRGDVVLFAAADSTGHGVPGALVSIICVNALNRAVDENTGNQPGEILTKAREFIIESFQQNNKEVQDGMDISMCALNLKSLELQWAGAYNPLWIVAKRNIPEADSYFSIENQLNDWILNEINPDRQPVGPFQNPSHFTNHTIQLNSDEIIYIFTDGYADQFGGSKGKKFKRQSLKEIVLSSCVAPMEEQEKMLGEVFENWRGQHEQVDDVCLIGVKVSLSK